MWLNDSPEKIPVSSVLKMYVKKCTLKENHFLGKYLKMHFKRLRKCYRDVEE